MFRVACLLLAGRSVFVVVRCSLFVVSCLLCVVCRLRLFVSACRVLIVGRGVCS